MARNVVHHKDAELEEFRALLEVPDTFEDGFNLTSLIGTIFVALIMVPGALYMELVAGMGIGNAAQWVTVLLFVEVAKRANARLSRAQLYILFFMSGILLGQNVNGTPLFRQYLVQSDAAISFGIADQVPHWVAPEGIRDLPRSFLTRAWLPAIGLMLFRGVLGNLDNTILGYGLFRITVDIEKLPFPMAPMGAQGIVAVAEQVEGTARSAGVSMRWRMFCIGAGVGMVFGLVYMALPTLTGAFFDRPVMVFPIPFADFSTYTKNILPAVATGISFDLGQVVLGMVLPFYAMVGSFIGLLITFILNPILWHFNRMPSWQPDDRTVVTLFTNNIDFYFSFGIGIALAIALYGVWVAIRTINRNRDEQGSPGSPAAARAGSGLPATGWLLITLVVLGSMTMRWSWAGLWGGIWLLSIGGYVARRVLNRGVPRVEDPEMAELRKQRGDIPDFWIGITYLIAVSAYLGVSGYLIGWDSRVMWVMLFFGFLYTPLISYVTARLEGLAGQVIEIPLVREMAFIISGYQGVDIWFLPIPRANYGTQVLRYKQSELLGCKFTSIWKSQLLLFPIVFVAMILFSSFIWGLNEIPHPVYPFTMEMWDLHAKNACLLYSATLGEYSPFREALGWGRFFSGFGTAMATMGLLAVFKAPTMLFFGVVRGLGQTLPHSVIPGFIGALIGRYYFQRRYGREWRKMIPTVSAGFFVGMGLITMLSVGLVFLSKAVTTATY